MFQKFPFTNLWKLCVMPICLFFWLVCVWYFIFVKLFDHFRVLFSQHHSPSVSVVFRSLLFGKMKQSSHSRAYSVELNASKILQHFKNSLNFWSNGEFYAIFRVVWFCHIHKIIKCENFVKDIYSVACRTIKSQKI